MAHFMKVKGYCVCSIKKQWIHLARKVPGSGPKWHFGSDNYFTDFDYQSLGDVGLFFFGGGAPLQLSTSFWVYYTQYSRKFSLKGIIKVFKIEQHHVFPNNKTNYSVTPVIHYFKKPTKIPFLSSHHWTSIPINQCPGSQFQIINIIFELGIWPTFLQDAVWFFSKHRMYAVSYMSCSIAWCSVIIKVPYWSFHFYCLEHKHAACPWQKSITDK